jgi:hypothetical protein
MAQSYISAHHKDGVLNLVMTPDMEEQLTDCLKQINLMSVLQGERTLEDVQTDDNFFKDCIRLKIVIDVEEVDPLFEAFKIVFRQYIQKTINHSDN